MARFSPAECEYKWCPPLLALAHIILPDILLHAHSPFLSDRDGNAPPQRSCPVFPWKPRFKDGHVTTSLSPRMATWHGVTFPLLFPTILFQLYCTVRSKTLC